MDSAFWKTFIHFIYRQPMEKKERMYGIRSENNTGDKKAGDTVCHKNSCTDLLDKIRGVIFGQAIGDALGLGTEFMSRDEVLKYYPHKLSSYNQIIQDSHRIGWKPGEWTDDTDMMLCIADAMIEDKDICLHRVARNFKKWFEGTPMGIGQHTNKVLAISDYTENPMRAADLVWRLSGERNAANGGVMRTSVVGLWKKDISFYAENICKLTHADPRCAGSCVILSELIHSFVWNNKELDSETIIRIGNKYDERIEPYLMRALEAGQIEDLKLDEASSMGYTLKTLSAAVWCLYHVESFQEGLLAVVNAGGDADTNAAVACSLLGAKYGYKSIPSCYIKNIIGKSLLEKVSDDLYEIVSGVGN